MKLDEKVKAYIDAQTYAQLLERWRFSNAGDTMFEGETGHYWATRMNELGLKTDTVAASKKVGF